LEGKRGVFSYAPMLITEPALSRINKLTPLINN
jgi:hypothetical protein